MSILHILALDAKLARVRRGCLALLSVALLIGCAVGEASLDRRSDAGPSGSIERPPGPPPRSLFHMPPPPPPQRLDDARLRGEVEAIMAGFGRVSVDGEGCRLAQRLGQQLRGIGPRTIGTRRWRTLRGETLRFRDLVELRLRMMASLEDLIARNNNSISGHDREIILGNMSVIRMHECVTWDTYAQLLEALVGR